MTQGRRTGTRQTLPGDMYDSAEPLTTEGTDDTIRAGLEDRLAAIERAEQRLAAGTYGVSCAAVNRSPTIGSRPTRRRS